MALFGIGFGAVIMAAIGLFLVNSQNKERAKKQDFSANKRPAAARQ